MTGETILHSNTDSIEVFLGNGNPNIVYGISCADILIRYPLFHIDYFCDRTADSVKYDLEKPVLSLSKLRDMKVRVNIIIVAGKKAFHSIYDDIVNVGIDADVFDFFSSKVFFREESFCYNNKEYKLFEHPYNCGYKYERMTERSVELPLAREFYKRCNDVIEVGCVTPYYHPYITPKPVHVVDPTDRHCAVDISASIFDIDLSGKNVCSISTLEHIGKKEYGMTEEKNAIEAIEKVLKESKNCFVTMPLGWNEQVDSWVRDNRSSSYVRIMSRSMNNKWIEIDAQEELTYKYVLGFTANELAIIEK